MDITTHDCLNFHPLTTTISPKMAAQPTLHVPSYQVFASISLTVMCSFSKSQPTSPELLQVAKPTISTLPQWVLKIILTFCCLPNTHLQVGIQIDILSLPQVVLLSSSAPFSLDWTPAHQLDFFSTDSTPKGTLSTLPMLVMSTSFSYIASLPQALKSKALKKVIPKFTPALHGLLKPFAKHIALPKVPSTPFAAPHASLKAMSPANNNTITVKFPSGQIDPTNLFPYTYIAEDLGPKCAALGTKF